MTREEAIERVRSRFSKWALDDEDLTALQTLGLVDHESKDEKIRKEIIEYLGLVGKGDSDYAQPMIDRWIAYLEKLKKLFESGRGLYYYDGEKTTYCGYPATEENPYDFAMSQQEKQKKPIDPFDTKLFQDGVKEGRRLEREDIMKEQKPVEPSDDELQRHQDELYNFKVFAAKQAKEYHISYVHDFEWNNFCAEILSYFNEQKPAEWNEFDEDCLKRAIWYVENPAPSVVKDTNLALWLKSIRLYWKPSKEQMGALNYAYCELFKREDVGHNILGPLQNLIDTLSKL